MEELFNKINSFPKRMISLSELEENIGELFKTYTDFSGMVLKLENDGILQMVKSKGRNSRTPSLAYQYRIDKSMLAAAHHQEIQRYRNFLHPSINLDEYYRKDPDLWKHDLNYILQIDKYLKTYSFPIETVPAPERSFEIVQDEKWITDKGGKHVLERIGLYEQLKIRPVSDPLMFAVNPKRMHLSVQYHLIVENKTTYQGLLPALQKTVFSTLIYGCGKKVIQSIEQFSDQYPIEAEHNFLYFGDIDREGLSIWHSLTGKINVIPAMPFYEACLAKPPAKGKDYQKQHNEAQAAFFCQIPIQLQEKIEKALANGKYYPQEILKSKELQQIWRETDWETLI